MSLPELILRNKRGFLLTAFSVAFSRLELLVIAIVGGLLSCALSPPMHRLATGTFNWSTFAKGTFEFRITAARLGAGLQFAEFTHVVGGWLGLSPRPGSPSSRRCGG